MESVYAEFEWTQQVVPGATPIGQVYGWLFDPYGRVLVQETVGGWNLPGGTPESYDGTEAATLCREAMEESQVEVRAATYLGYESASRQGVTCALVRMTARITRFHARQPDPDNGQLYGRWMVSADHACELLGWGDAGLQQAEAAVTVARRDWGLPSTLPTRPAEHID